MTPAISDQLLAAQVRDRGLSVHVALTTGLVREACAAHGLANSSTIALGRLLTATALAGLSQERPGTTSVQVVCRGPFSNIYADVNDQGDLRGFVRNPQLALPQTTDDPLHQRHLLAAGVGRGNLAVIREPNQGHFTQSSTELISGELDLDLEHFLRHSEQIPSTLGCEVLLDDDGAVRCAGGLLVQTLPEGDASHLAVLRTMFDDGLLAQVLSDGLADVQTLLTSLIPEAVVVEEPLPLRWQCRCSHDKVLGAVAMLEREELVGMIDRGEPGEVQCDFCARRYELGVEDLQRALELKRTRDENLH